MKYVSIRYARSRRACPAVRHFIEFYDDLPKWSICLHAHRVGWHLSHLKIDDVINKVEFKYFYFNFGALNPPGDEVWSTLPRDEEDWERVCKWWHIVEDYAPLPSEILAYANGQFYIHKDVIRSIKKDHYKKWYEWSMNDPEDNCPYFMEHLWCYLFTGEQIEPQWYKSEEALYSGRKFKRIKGSRIPDSNS